ncbi:MAG: hypothetical protein ABI076_11480 [Acidobacteriaceae bacterium]
MCPATYADFASAPATGGAIVTHGKFTNVYLYQPSFPGETWDHHLAVQHRTETRGAIDGFLTSLTRSSYFFLLTQYGISPPVFLGGAPTVANCVEDALRDRVNGVIQWNTLRSFAACQQAHDGMPSDQMNIFVSPELNVAGPNFGPDSSPAICRPGSGVSAYHAWGLGVPNFSVIPLHPACNPNLSAVADVTSHEMVEILSDPAGFGYLHETGPIGRSWPGDFIPDLNSGELGDICEKGDKGPASIPFGTLKVSTYWSNVDNTCEPRFIMNRTLLTSAGSPLIRFTGSIHDLPRPLTVLPEDQLRPIQQMMVLVTTGGDNLNGGNGPNDNADAIITLRNGRMIRTNNINWGHSWGNNEFHAVNLVLSPGVRAADLVRLTLHTNFNGNDNWNVNKLQLMAALGAASRVSPPANTFSAVVITSATGNDNARSDTEISGQIGLNAPMCLKPSNNANPNSTCNNNGHAADQNGQQEWKNWTSSTQTFNFRIPVALPALRPLTIRMITHNNGTEGDDNWDIQGIRVVALPTDASQPPVTLLNFGNLDNVHRGSKACIRRLTGHSGTTTFNLPGPNSIGPCNE